MDFTVILKCVIGLDIVGTSQLVSTLYVDI